MLLAGYAGIATVFAAIGGEWAIPANTALLILLAIVQARQTRNSRKALEQHEYIAKQLVDVREQVTPGNRSPAVRTRKGDSPPWPPQ